MVYRFKVLSYWHERSDTVSAIAARVDATLNELLKAFPELPPWSTAPHDGTRIMVPYDKSTFKQIELEKHGRPKPVEPGGAYYANLLTCFDSLNYCELSVTAGGDGFAPNSCNLIIGRSPHFDRLRTLEGQRTIMQIVIENWRPDFALSTSTEFMELRDTQWHEWPKRVPRIGWLTYLPAHRRPIPNLAPPASVESFGALGSIVVACPEPSTVEKPKTIAAVDAVEAQLKAAGLLEPEPIRVDVDSILSQILK